VHVEPLLFIYINTNIYINLYLFDYKLFSYPQMYKIGSHTQLKKKKKQTQRISFAIIIKRGEKQTLQLKP